MRKELLAALVLLGAVLLAGTPGGAPLKVLSHEVRDGGLLIRLEGGRLKVTPLSPAVTRVQYTAGEDLSDRQSLVVLDREAKGSFDLEEDDEGVRLLTSSLAIEVSKESGSISAQYFRRCSKSSTLTRLSQADRMKFPWIKGFACNKACAMPKGSG